MHSVTQTGQVVYSFYFLLGYFFYFSKTNWNLLILTVNYSLGLLLLQLCLFLDIICTIIPDDNNEIETRNVLFDYLFL